MSHAAKAEEIFNRGLNCAQAVFGAFAEETGLEEKDALRIAACFGGGMQEGEVCGAVTGALMTLGRRFEGTPDSRPRSNAAARDFLERFRARCQAVRCEDLLGYNLGTPEGKERTKQRNGARDPRCIDFIKEAVMVLEEMLDADAS